MPIKQVRNKTNLPLCVIHEGTQMLLDPLSTEHMEESLADLFARKYPDSVELDFEEIGGEAVAEAPPEEFWVANMTGDPDCPKTIKMKVHRNKEWIYADEPNPAAIAHELKEWCDGGMQEYKEKDGSLAAKNLAGRYISIPPFKRVRMASGIADWFLNRISVSAPITAGDRPVKAIKSRQPSSFEPDMSWTLDEMRAYLRLIDPSAPIGDAEAQIKRRAEATKDSIKGFKEELHEAKKLCMKRIFFRVVDPKYAKLPTRQEFNEFISGRFETTTQMTGAQVEQMIEKSLQSTTNTNTMAPIFNDETTRVKRKYVKRAHLNQTDTTPEGTHSV